MLVVKIFPGSPLRYLSSSIQAGTKIIEIKKVVDIPIIRVMPTVLIGFIGTSSGHINTLKPIIVVRAERKIAFPVVMAALTVASRLISGSKGSGGVYSLPSLFSDHSSSLRFLRMSVLFSSILLVRWRE